MLSRIAAGISANVIIALVLIGVPALLITLFGNPLPTASELASAARLQPDWNNHTLLSVVLPCATWIAWTLFAIPLLAEIGSLVTGKPQNTSAPMFRLQRLIARTLVTTALFTAIAPTFPSAAPAQAQAVVIGTETRGAPAPSDFSAHDDLSGAIGTGPAVPAAGDRKYRVTAGDTLWSIANEYLGSGRDYPAIVDASKDIEQPDGARLTNPDVILPGWQVDIPSADRVHARPPTRKPTPADHPPKLAVRSASAPERTANAASPTSRSKPSATTPTRQPEASETATGAGPSSELPPTAIAGGVAALLAAGLLTTLGRRRRRQRSVRNFGERVALPAAGVEDVERQLSAVQDPRTIDNLENALAHVEVWVEDNAADLPQLFAVRIDDELIALYLARPAELPPPFESAYGDNTAWVAPRTAFGPPSRRTVAPYPALVTIGTDQDEGLLLLDLEQLGVLTVAGNETLTRAALNAIAAEFASVPWANDIHLSLVGLPADLPFELDPYRIHRVADVATLCRDLRVHLADRQQALLQSQFPNIRRARVVANDVEAWAPFVVLIATDCTQAEHGELMQLALSYSSTGLVIVETGPADLLDATIELHSTIAASYRSSGAGLPALPFAPQLLDHVTLASILELFATGNAPPVAAPSNDGVDGTSQVPTATSQPSNPRAEAGAAPASSPARTSAAIPSTAEGVPYVRLLGPVDALNVAGIQLLPGRGVEFLAYLLTHQQPVSGAQIQKALWPSSYDRSNNNTRTLAKQVRSALGHDSEGHLWLPEGRGTTGFTLHPAIRSDWDDFRALTGPNPSVARTENLETALRLVREQPLLGTDARRGRWAWRAALEEEIIATILDTAKTLADRALPTADVRLTHMAAKTARAADPLNELSWQIELRAAAATASSREVERIIDDLYAAAGAGNPEYEPDEETSNLIAAGRSATRHKGHQ